ncbi:MAG: hypothetical protein KKC68_03165, partial [Candidatus Thermoplasmatota archaeon]|nr:hypothetical protein [Candidatus Thermoplasmatota archaeon]MBU1940752.1 hypothetical protein [Candidatus Thermoplasmatota archaeon]
MKKTIVCISLFLVLISSVYAPVSIAVQPGEISSDTISVEYRNVTVFAPAVAQTTSGYRGVISTITVTIQSQGTGRVFVDTLPLTQIDMQGSARLAVSVANALVRGDPNLETNPDLFDYFFVVRTEAPIIGGPSAGAIMTVAVVSLLENWEMDNQTVMTGMINPDGSIGPVGGIVQKVDAAASVGAHRFLILKGQNTYTETITETSTTDSGWTQIITRPVTRNVSDYAAQKYGIEVVEIEDVNDAIWYFTGYTFPETVSNDSITTEDYIDSMKPLATSLLKEARTLYQNASFLFNTTEISNYYPYYFRNQVTDYLNGAKQNFQESQSWFDQDLYYTSTSNSFQSLIDAQFVIYACEYFQAEDSAQYVTDLLRNITMFHANMSAVAKNATIVGATTLQCVGAAQKRASDAASYLMDAETNIQNQNYLSALTQLAYALKRSESVKWWLNISQAFSDPGIYNHTTIESLAQNYIEDAQQSVTYSGLLLQEMGHTSSYLAEAENLLETARDDQTSGYAAAALFEALESLVKANLALELIDGMTDDKLQRAQESASGSIAESRNEGIEPVLAVSYYEYGQSLVNESTPEIAVVYYKYADLIAGALLYTGSYNSGSSRYVGIPEINTPTYSAQTIRYFSYFIVFAVIGLIGGIGLGILISSGMPQKKKEKGSYHTHNGQIPRSIEDYYRK